MKYKVIFRWDGHEVLAPVEAEVLRYGCDHVKPHIKLDGKEYKHCAGCNTWKRLSKFQAEKQMWDGLQGYCTVCNRKASVDYNIRYKVLEAG